MSKGKTDQPNPYAHDWDWGYATGETLATTLDYPETNGNTRILAEQIVDGLTGQTTPQHHAWAIGVIAGAFGEEEE